MRFGCHAVLFRERIKSETEFIIKGLSETGFKGMEVGARFFGMDEKQKLIDLLIKYGMEVSGLHVGCGLIDWVEKEEECMNRVMAAARFVKDMPNKNIILSGSDVENYNFKAVALNIEKAAKACRNIGVKLNYHNHAWEFKNNGEAFKALVEYAPSLYFALDLGWVSAGGFDPIETVLSVKDRVCYVHLRDTKEKCSKEFLDLGKGCYNYSELLSVLEDVLPQDGWAVVEYEEGEQSFERYRRAKEFLDTVMEG
jgi:inosose dehydratase